MKLKLFKVVNGCRLGVLTNLGRNGDKSLEIPGCLLYTRTGSPPHLTHDTLSMIEGVPAVTQLTLSSLAEHHEVLEEYTEGIGKFIGMPHSVLYCSLQDPAIPSPPGYNTNKTVSVWGTGGRIELTTSKFMAMQQAFRPDWYQCMADGDSISEGASKKRVKKSVDRSLTFLDECLRIQQVSPALKTTEVVGVIEGGDILEERKRSARETSKRPVGGFLLDCLQEDCMDRELRLTLISSVTAELPEEKPRLIQGVGRPDEVLECVERGVDIFESSFPYLVTERGCALSFCYTLLPDPETAVLTKNGIENSEKSDEMPENCMKDRCDSKITPFEMDVKDERYQDDFRPLVQGCTCYCCSHHTRAYVHHLLMTKELLAGVLLMIHNFQHYFSFFHSVRSAVKEERLDSLKELLRKQTLQF
ncbi:queuine tRNA-ribosyltransferase accessory subunit 2 [Protopterus annectens]|uniref:queuine tRNA-ribosyltransferase accessory subunit 2 n=1 Tax=Protopterus annectens TaxID=7888 RepID=UPI001CF940A2|nr:queuine tRNA-ribosyltransferase accessory subunit 2 [Protopterus annectens]